MERIIECVPNFSEGRNLNIIKQITDKIEAVEGIKLLEVDQGMAANRTVVTFVGKPDAVIEAAFQSVKMASEVIDMRKHTGAHPRYGATDVCPLIPITGVTMEETVEYSRKLAERIGNELNISVYCYANSAYSPEKKDLANCRSGEYEGLRKKLMRPEWKPDFGPTILNDKAGAITIGARDFLVAYNINLNTKSIETANAIACDVRERGRAKREGNCVTGKIVKNESGKTLMIAGTLKHVKAIGWFIEEYDKAQVSMNLTNINVTPVHIAFDEVCKKAKDRGTKVTGSELIGLIPLNAILQAGKYFLSKQKKSVNISDNELIKIAIKSLGLDELKEFKPEKKIIEYLL